MKNKMFVLIAGLLAALVVIGVVGAANAYAQSPLSELHHGGGPGGRGLGLEGLQIAAKALDMTTDELINALQNGQTLEELATEAGVDIQDIRDEIREARTTAFRKRIQQAVTDGAITQEHADWLLEGLDKGFIGGPDGFGFGHGFKFGPRPDHNPTAEPTQSGG